MSEPESKPKKTPAGKDSASKRSAGSGPAGKAPRGKLAQGAKKEAPPNAFEAYGGGDEMPLDGYVWLLGAFGVAAASVVAAAASGRRFPKRVSPTDVVLIGVATHKLTRIVTRDWVTAPLRAPFTEFQKSLGSGEVQETSRGEGLQRAIGDLLTCPFCTGPWIAGALFSGLVFSPRVTRLVAATFASVALSDWLHHAYGIVRAARKDGAGSGF
ncbi:MAG: DUF1360 domain-containing protein [Thermoanaerobaculia bacterium]